jgi:hypothetical protein
MKRFLNWFSRASRSHRAPPPRRPFRPQLEPLGDRIVPSSSVTSSAISIYHPLGPYSYTERDWFALDLGANQVVEFSGTTRHNLGGPRNVVALAASVDPATGSGEVFALARPDSFPPFPQQLWRCDSSGNWLQFSGGYYGAWNGTLSATRDGHVFALAWSSNDVLYLDSQGNAIDLGKPSPSFSPGTIAASVGWFGDNEVFVTGSSTNTLYVCPVSQPGAWQLVDNSHGISNLSATPDNTLFALDSYHRLYQVTEHFYMGYFYWTAQDISAGRQFDLSRGISADRDASGQDEVYAVEQGTNNLYLYDQGTWTLKDTSVLDVDGADGGYFYDVNNYANLLYAYLYNPDTYPHWSYLGSGLE